MNDQDVDEDPYLINSWGEHCKTCLSIGRRELFIKKISDYIYETNLHKQKELDLYTAKRVREIIDEKMEDSRKENMKYVELAKNKRKYLK